MKYFKKLIGKQVYLSPMNVEDVEFYVKWLNQFEITDGLGTSCRPAISILSEKEWLEKNSKEGYNFAIVDLKNDQLIGNCSIMEVNHISRTATVGLFIGETTNHSKGYGTDALKLLVDYGFNYLNLNNIMLRVFSFNEQAISCYKKVGFKEIGRRRNAYFLNGKYHDDVFMDILASEFIESYIENKNI